MVMQTHENQDQDGRYRGFSGWPPGGTRIFGGSAVALAAAILLFAPAPAQAQNTPQRGGSVVMAVAADPAALNPAITTSVPDLIVGCTIYEGLTEVAGPDNIVPLLAKSWTISDDGKTYTFKLNKADWQDGQPFTSADVKFSLLEINSKVTPAFAVGAGKAISTIETPTPDEVVIKLNRPFGPLLRSLACLNGGPILPQHVFQGGPVMSSPATTTSPVGTGPFKLAEWKHGEYLRLVRNDNYWQKGKPYLDEVLVQPIPQSSSRTQAMQAGEVDFIPYFYLAANDISVLRQDPKIKIATAKVPPAQDILFFNLRHKPLDDKRVRQALMIATDRNFLLKNGWLGQGRVGTAPFTTQIKWAANPAIDYDKMYPFNPSKANALLDAAGLKRDSNGIRFKFNLVFVSTDVDSPRVALVIQQMWHAVGVDVQLTGYDRPTAEKQAFLDFNFDGYIDGYTSYGDPAVGLARIFVSSSIGKAYGNPSGYSRPDVDQLFAEGEAGLTNDARGAIYRKVQTILADDLPELTLRERVLYDAYTTKLQNVDSDTFFESWKYEWLKK